MLTEVFEGIGRALSFAFQMAWEVWWALILGGADGRTFVSADAGRSFKPGGTIGGQPAAFASHGDELLVALHDSSIKRSTDGGRTWTIRAKR